MKNLSNAEARRVGVVSEKESDQKMWEVLDVFLLGSLILLCLSVFVTILEFILDKMGAIKITYSGFYSVFGIIIAADLVILFISAYSDAFWPLIPIQGGHPFRSKMATCSDPLWPVIPIQSGHP